MTVSVYTRSLQFFNIVLYFMYWLLTIFVLMGICFIVWLSSVFIQIYSYDMLHIPCQRALRTDESEISYMCVCVCIKARCYVYTWNGI